VIVSAASTESVQGGCYGFSVCSSLPFAYLREGGGKVLHVTEHDGGLSPEPGPVTARWRGGPDKIETRLHSTVDRDRLWLEHVGWFEIDARIPAIGLPELPSQPAGPTPLAQRMAWREASMWGMPAVVCFTRGGYVPIHAASVEVNGAGLVLGAPGTFGKTTLAAAFLREGHRLLSDDMACCDLRGAPTILPGPALLRLRRDVAQWLAVPATRFAYATAPKIALALEPEVRGDSAPLPLKAIVLLRKSDHGARLTPAEPADAVRDLFVLSPKGVFDPSGAFQDIVQLVAAVPVWYFDRRLDPTALRDSVNQIIEICARP
jgi:hypothetical protein